MKVICYRIIDGAVIESGMQACEVYSTKAFHEILALAAIETDVNVDTTGSSDTIEYLCTLYEIDCDGIHAISLVSIDFVVYDIWLLVE